MSFFITKALQAIGHFFGNLFNAAEKAYNQLTPEQQAALQQGSGLVDIIRNKLTAAPAEVRAEFQAKFPGIDEAKLESVAFQVAGAFGLKGFASLDDVIKAIQDHIAAQPSEVVDAVLHGLASTFALLFGPPESKMAVVASLIEWVYLHFIKKG